MRQRHSRTFLVIALLLTLIGANASLETFPLCRGVPAAEASSFPPSVYCYSFQVSIGNSSPADLTDVAVAFEVNSGNLLTLSRMSQLALDLRPVTTALSPVEVTAQDITLDPARWWLNIPSLPTGSNFTFQVYTGFNAAQRNQGFLVTGSDTLTVTDHADFDITDNLEVVGNVFTSNTSQDAWFVTKWTLNAGYRFGVRALDGTLIAQVDDKTVTAVWDGSLTWLRMTFVNPTLNIDSWNTTTLVWDNLATSNTGLGAITANVADLVMGDGYTGVLRDVEVYDNFGAGGYAPVEKWGFAAEDITELTAVNPTYTGTVTGDLGNHNAAYSLTRDQTNFSVVVGALVTSEAATTITFTQKLGDLLGEPSTTDLFTSMPAASRFPFYALINGFGTDIGLTPQAWWFILLATLGFIAAIGVYTWLRAPDFAYIVMLVFIAIGPPLGLFDPWVLIVCFIGLVGLWTVASRLAKE